MGEKKKEEEKKPKGGGGAENAPAPVPAAVGPTLVVLKVDMHCEGCALKIKRAVKGFPGVEAVSTDMANNKLTVVGNADPLKIRERLESKTRKKVDLISPVPMKDPPPKESEPKKGQSDPKEQKKPEDKKPTPPVSKAVVLKIRLHCDGCIQRIRKTILRYKGVEGVTIDSQKDLVTVMGTMDVNSLALYLKDKLKRSVEIVPTKKDNDGGGGGGGGEKKGKTGVGNEKAGNANGDGEKTEMIGRDDEKKDEKTETIGGGDDEKKDENDEKKKKEENGGDSEKKEKDGNGQKKKKNENGKNGKKKESGGNGEKKKNDEKKENCENVENKKNGGNNGNGKKKTEDVSGEKKEGGGDEKQAPKVVTETNKMEYYGTYGYTYGYDGIGNDYHMEMVSAPQMFSDENPNACLIM